MARQREACRTDAASAAAYAFRLFGRFAVRRTADGADLTPRGRKARALIAFLLLESRPVDRDRLAGLLWSERGQAQAHASLRQTLLELRDLAQGPAPLLRIERQQVATTGAAALDIDAMAAMAANGDAEGLAAALGEGDVLLADMDGLDPAYDQWLRAMRITRGDALVAAAYDAARMAIASGQTEAALHLARQLQRLDPFDETAARLAMEAAAASGQPHIARRIYDGLCKTLRGELGTGPGAETRALHDRLATTAAAAQPAPSMPLSPPAKPVLPVPPSRDSRPRWILAVAGLLLIAAAGFAWWRWQSPPLTPTIAVVAAEGSEAAALARDIALDLVRLAGSRSDSIAVVDPSSFGRSDYVVRVGSARTNAGLEADLSLRTRGNSELLWSSRFHRPPEQLADLRQQMSAKLGSVLLCATDPRLRAERVDHATRRLFLAACDQLDDPPSEQRRLVLRELVERAPRFAWGWATLAEVEAGMAAPVANRSESGNPPEAAKLRESARAALTRARALDPSLGQIYAAELELTLRPRNWAERLAILDRGLTVDPHNPRLHQYRALVLADVGRGREARASARRAVELDPLSPWSRSRLIISSAYTGDLPGAWRELADAERIWPGATALRDARFRLAFRYGDPREALRIIEADETRGLPGSTTRPADRLFLLARLDPSPQNITATLRPYRARQRRTAVAAPSHVMALAQFGMIDEAYRLLEPESAWHVLRLATDIFFRPEMAVFRRDRRFPALTARSGLLQYWQSTGEWPDFCLDPELPYDCREEARRLLGLGEQKKGTAR